MFVRHQSWWLTMLTILSAGIACWMQSGTAAEPDSTADFQRLRLPIFRTRGPDDVPFQPVVNHDLYPAMTEDFPDLRTPAATVSPISHTVQPPSNSIAPDSVWRTPSPAAEPLPPGSFAAPTHLPPPYTEIPPPQPAITTTAGFSFVFLKPRFDDNLAFTIRDSTNFPNEFTTERNFEYDYELSPRVWLQLHDATGLGFRVAYWKFDHGAGTETVRDPGAGDMEFFGPETLTATGGLTAGSVAGPGDTVTANSGLELYTLDAELTQRIDRGLWQIEVGGGFRHAAIAQNYSATAVDAGGTLFALSEVAHRFDGIGPTLFAEFQRPLSVPGFFFFAGGRASLLYGDTKYQATDREFGAFTDTARTVEETTLRIYGVQIGGRYAVVNTDGTALFAQAAWESQIWDGAGNASRPDKDDLGLMGFNVSVGLER